MTETSENPRKNKYPNGVAADGTPDPALERTGCNYPNKGLKDHMDAEGGVKVPTMIIRTKGKFKKGQFR